MHQSNIFGNGDYAFRANVSGDPNTTIDASGNWWGTADPDSIAALIFDHADDATCPTVATDPHALDSLILSSPTDVPGVSDDLLPDGTCLRQNRPNPFNAETHVPFSLAKTGAVQLEVFNVLGQRVRTLVSQRLAAGDHEVVFDGSDSAGRALASGVYLYRLRTESGHLTRRMILLK